MKNCPARKRQNMPTWALSLPKLFDTLMLFLKEYFEEEKSNIEKHLQMTKKVMKNYPA